MKLRPYQEKLIQDVYMAWTNCHPNVIMQLSTGGGKTVTFTEIIATYNKPTLVIAHRTELIHQTALTLAQRGLFHHIVGSEQTIRDAITIQMQELGKSYYHPLSEIVIASVDTLIKNPLSFTKRVELVIIDEGHHVLKNNKWGKCLSHFPNALCLFPTATPIRADGKGLGRHADGFVDVIVQGPSTYELMQYGYLSNYRIFVPPSDLNLSDVPITTTGDYSPSKLSKAIHRSHITGDIVHHYLKFASGKLGITFVVDLETARKITEAFKIADIPAEMITAKTPPLKRAHIMKQFRNREILQLVNVDILGEGVDVPAVEVISLARPTQSLSLYLQQVGRGLRPIEGKTHCIIVDHVGNALRHGLPDTNRTWTLNARERRISTKETTIKIKTCLHCYFVYLRELSLCPYCGYKPEPQNRNTIETVEGDLLEISPTILEQMRNKIDAPVKFPRNATSAIRGALIKRHREKQEAQQELRESIALYAGFLKSRGYSDSRIYKHFYLEFGQDILSMQLVNTKDAKKLKNLIDKTYNKD